MVRCHDAYPIVVLDEVEKAGGSTQSDPLAGTMKVTKARELPSVSRRT